jgi:hypothetical protein
MDLQELLIYINRNEMLPKYSGINPKGGFNHRLRGITTAGKPGAGLSAEDKSQVKDGLQKFIQDINQVIETL